MNSSAAVAMQLPRRAPLVWRPRAVPSEPASRCCPHSVAALDGQKSRKDCAQARYVRAQSRYPMPGSVSK